MGNFEKFIMLLLLASIPVCAGILSYGAIEYYGLAEQVRNVAPTARAYAIEYRGWLIGGGILYALIRGSFYLWSLHLHTMAIASAFGVAELELNGLIKKYKGQSSRLQRVKERSEWYHDIAKIAPAPVGLFGRADPYPKTVSDDIIAWNEKEAQSKKAGMWAKGVVKGVISSVHSMGEDGDDEKEAYNRVVDTRTGEALVRKHSNKYETCQTVCEETDGDKSCMVYVPFKRRYHGQPDCLLK